MLWKTAQKMQPDSLLSQRFYIALTAGKDELFQVMEDPSMEVLQTALKNPLLDENHLLALLKRRDLSEDLLKAIATPHGRGKPQVEAGRRA